MAYRKDENGVVWRSATNGKWYKTELSNVPVEAGDVTLGEKKKAYHEMPTRSRRARYHDRQREIREQLYQDELARRGPNAQARAEQAREAGFLAKNAISAGRETDKLITGTADFVDFVADATNVGDRLPLTPMDMIAKLYFNRDAISQRAGERRQDQEDKDRVYKEFDENAGFTGKIGAMAPYLVTGYAGGPVATGATRKGVEMLGKSAARTDRMIRGGLTKAVDYGRHQRGKGVMGDLVGDISMKAKKEIVNPLNRRAMRAANTEKMVDPWRPHGMTDVLGYGGLGGIEGGLYYGDDTNMITGTIASLGGGLAGQFLKPRLQRMPDFYRKEDRRIVEWAKDLGIEMPPGMERGHHGYQMFESKLRTDAGWTDLMEQFDNSTQRALNRKIFSHMGFENNIDEVGSAELRKHMSNLSEQYRAIENASTGKFTYNDMKQLYDIQRLLKSRYRTSGQAFEDGMNLIRDAYKVQRHTRGSKRGQFKTATYDGKQYQKIRKTFKDAANEAYAQGKTSAGDTLMQAVKVIDGSLERGMKEYGGKASAKQWKDLNLKYALTKTVEENGMKGRGNIDFSSMRNYFLSKDPDRFLRENASSKGFNDLYRASKFQNIVDTQAKKGLASSDIVPTNMFDNPKRMSPFHRLLHTPYAAMVPLKDQLFMKIYMKGYPSTTGLMNLSGKELQDPALWTRAMGQSSQMYPEFAETVGDVADGAMWLGGKVGQGAANLYDMIDGWTTDPGDITINNAY